MTDDEYEKPGRAPPKQGRAAQIAQKYFPSTSQAVAARQSAIQQAPTIATKLNKSFAGIPAIASGVVSDVFAGPAQREVLASAVAPVKELITGVPARPQSNPSAAPASTRTTAVRPDEMVGQYKRELTPGGVKYTGPGGEMEGKGTGSGTFSVVSGPGRGNMSQQQWEALPNEERIARNVASYDAQTQAVRELREAKRAAQGERPVGDRGSDTPLVIGQAEGEKYGKEVRGLLKRADEAPGPKAKAAYLDAATELARPDQEEKLRPSFQDQLGIAKLNLDANKAAADVTSNARIARLKEEDNQREGIVAGVTVGKMQQEMRQKEIEEVGNDPRFDKAGLPASAIVDLSNAVGQELPNVDPGSIKAQVAQELAEMEEKGMLGPKLDLSTLKQRVLERTQRAMQ